MKICFTGRHRSIQVIILGFWGFGVLGFWGVHSDPLVDRGIAQTVWHVD